MPHAIEAAKSGRSLCATCSHSIEKGELRLDEEVSHLRMQRRIHRYHHLECAITALPDLVHAALGTVGPDVVFDRKRIEDRIAGAVARDQERRRTSYDAQVAREQHPAIVEDDEATRDLLDRLASDPEDRDTLTVLADQLQVRGELRGELIAIQLALADGALDETLVARRTELMLALSPPLEKTDRCVWGTGFVRRVELAGRTGLRLAKLWDAMSMRLLRELKIVFQSALDARFTARLAELAPKSLRVLELAVASDATLPQVAKVVAALPRLQTLSLAGKLELESIAHPSLERLELGWHEVHVDLHSLHIAQLPALHELGFVSPHGGQDLDIACDHVAREWLGRIDRLALRGGRLGEHGIDALALGLGGRKLARIDLTDTEVALELRARLLPLCDELVLPNVVVDPDRELWVEHTGKPEWGRGKLVRRFAGKIEVKFPKLDAKVFKADAPFLRFG